MGLFSRKIKINAQVKKLLDDMIADMKEVSPQFAEDMRYDLLLFLLNQVASDGVVAKEEVQFINGYFDMSWTVDSMIKFLNQHHSGIKNYTLPNTIVKFTLVYKEMAKDAETSEVAAHYRDLTLLRMETFLLILIVLCKGIISIDGDISDEEIENLNKIINDSSDFIEEKLGFVPKGVETARKELVK